MTNKEYIATLSSTDLATLLETYIADLKHGNTVITTRQKFIEFLEAESEAKSNSAAKIDNVNRPKHYTRGKVECIDAIEAATEELTGFEGLCTGNAIKYLWRWKKKNGAEDLKKAKWYIDRLLKKLEGDGGNV